MYVKINDTLWKLDYREYLRLKRCLEEIGITLRDEK